VLVPVSVAVPAPFLVNDPDPVVMFPLIATSPPPVLVVTVRSLLVPVTLPLTVKPPVLLFVQDWLLARTTLLPIVCAALFPASTTMPVPAA